MKQRLPSLHALRAFESAARLGAFNKAADELGLSATAISHHIRGLEVELGTRLFVRNTRKITLTDDGMRMADVCKGSFQALRDVIGDLRNRRGRSTVTIALGPLLASRWLTPRLNLFWEKFPGIDLNLLHTSLQVDPNAITADIYLAWGDGNWANLESRPFLAVSMLPVASRDYLKNHARLQRVEQLLDHNLIHQRDKSGWEHWLAGHNVKLPSDTGGMVIEDANVVLRTAMSGQGIALGWLPLVEDEISAGKLVPLFSDQRQRLLGYHLIKPPNRQAKPEIAEVEEWLIGESTTTKKKPPASVRRSK